MSLFVALVLAWGDDLPTLTERVNDLAGVIDPATNQALTEKLRALEQSDSTQVVVLTVRTTGGKEIEAFTRETATKNKIGQAHKNNGVLIVVAVDDRKCWITVGYGLEGRLTDAATATIIRREMVPHFKEGKHALGIRKGTEAVIGTVRGEYTADSLGRKSAFRENLALGYLLALVPIALVSQWLLYKKNHLAIGCVLHIVLLVVGIVGLFEEFTFSDIFASIAAAILFLAGGNVVGVMILGIFGVIKSSGSGSSKGWSWIHSSSSSSGSGWSSSSSSSSSFSGGGGSFGGGGAGGSW